MSTHIRSTDQHAALPQQIDQLLADTGLHTLRTQLIARNRPDLQRAFDAMASALLSAHPAQAQSQPHLRTRFDRVFRPARLSAATNPQGQAAER